VGACRIRSVEKDDRLTRSGFARQPLATVIDRYDRLAPWYRFAEPSILLRPGFRRQAVARLGLKAGQSVLEIGCGTGRNLRFLREAVGASGRVTGVDVFAGMLAQADKTVMRHGWQNVRLIEQDASTLALDEPVDVVYFSLSYSVLPDRDVVLDRAWEALPSGGQLAIMDAHLPENLLGRVLGPAAEAVATAFPGDPYSEPWKDLVRLSPYVQIERFQLDL
jgi:demethylmenaquinone methyltransferase/2-methoxy-6-polyprenyl-1,4-benzoquinol methylase